MPFWLKDYIRRSEYAHIHSSPALNPDRVRIAEKAIARGRYEEAGKRTDGALILVTKTVPPLVAVARKEGQSAGKQDLYIMYLAQVSSSAN